MRHPQPFMFSPKNPKKYLGNVSQIVCRSGLEHQFFKIFDTNSSIVSWGSEEIIIPYFYELDQKIHRYFPDIIVECKQPDNSIKKFICEIKPALFCVQPDPPKKMSRGYIMRMNDFIKNTNKWNAAELFCKAHGMQFLKLTELDLGFLK